jgi:hypothetical protein
MPRSNTCVPQEVLRRDGIRRKLSKDAQVLRVTV